MKEGKFCSPNYDESACINCRKKTEKENPWMLVLAGFIVIGSLTVLQLMNSAEPAKIMTVAEQNKAAYMACINEAKAIIDLQRCDAAKNLYSVESK
jgi:hypothetical protein